MRYLMLVCRNRNRNLGPLWAPVFNTAVQMCVAGRKDMWNLKKNGNFNTWFVFCGRQRDGTLSAGRSAYINYCGILQQFVQAYISKQQVKTKRTLSSCVLESLTIPPLFFFRNSHVFLWPLSEFCSMERGTVWRGADSTGALRYAERPLAFSPGPGVSTVFTFSTHRADESTAKHKIDNKQTYKTTSVNSYWRSVLDILFCPEYLNVGFEHTIQLHVTTAMGACSAPLSVSMDVCFPDRKWVAYSKLYQSLEVDSSVLFQQLTSIEYHWHQQALPYQQVQVPTSNNIHLLTCDT